MKKNQNNPRQHMKLENPWFLGVAVVGLMVGGLLFASNVLISGWSFPLLCGGGPSWGPSSQNSTDLQPEAILHYATSHEVPQQTLDEITVSFDVLRSLGPSNFLIFGLGLDSLMWAALNPGGRTLFLEEDPAWVKTVLKDVPGLHAHTVRYRTKVSEADELMKHYFTEPDCSAKNSFLRGNHKCRLALNMLPDEVYDTEWDIVMVDAPQGYIPQVPGRMAAIYSAAVMARKRKKSGVTHVLVHDVNRKVEKMYAEAFLCKKHLVKAVGRLWHFQIPPPRNFSTNFC